MSRPCAPPNSCTSSSPATSSSSGDPARPETALDLRGEVCPFTFVRARVALEGLPLGAVLRLVVDHAPALRNIPRSAAEWGQEVLEVAGTGPGPWHIRLRKRVD